MKSTFLKYHFPQFLPSISRPDLIKFEEHVKKILNSLWIRPIFTIIPLNSSEFLKIGKFGIIFDAIPLEIDDISRSRLVIKALEGNDATSNMQFIPVIAIV